MATRRAPAMVTPGEGHRRRPASPAISSLPVPWLEAGTLIVPPFRIRLGRQCFVQRSALRIDLSRIEPDLYRIIAVQNFWVEDHNPDLEECQGAVFLARRCADGQWEAPENWPVECRTVALLAHLDCRVPGPPSLLPRDHPL